MLTDRDCMSARSAICLPLRSGGLRFSGSLRHSPRSAAAPNWIASASAPSWGRGGSSLHSLYVDDTGDVANANETHFVLGGISVFERGLYDQIKLADDCVASFKLGDPHDIELHGSAMYNGRDGLWRSVNHRPTREDFIKTALATLEGHASVRLFAVIVDKSIAGIDPIAYAFEEICNRFNLFITRNNDRHPNEGDQRGLIIMDESKHELALQSLARQFRIGGARWGHFRTLAEVPLFVDSKASRLIQLADLVAWATFRKYEFQDGRFFDPLIRIFDSDGGVIHGLVHRHSSPPCYCPACMSRRP